MSVHFNAFTFIVMNGTYLLCAVVHIFTLYKCAQLYQDLFSCKWEKPALNWFRLKKDIMIILYVADLGSQIVESRIY